MRDTEIDFSYGPDRARYQKIWSYGDRIDTTTYIGGLYEKIVSENSLGQPSILQKR